jgi:SnoaL-like domain
MHPVWRRLIPLVGVSLCSSCAASTPATAGDVDQRRLVADVIARFTDLAARRDLSRLPELFVEEAVWESGAGGLGYRHEGRDAIAKWLASNPNRVEVLFYLSSPPVVELVAPDRARSRTTMTELLRFLDTGEVRQLFGMYSDELVLRAGRWRFAHRRFELRYETSHGVRQKQARGP